MVGRWERMGGWRNALIEAGGGREDVIGFYGRREGNLGRG